VAAKEAVTPTERETGRPGVQGNWKEIIHVVENYSNIITLMSVSTLWGPVQHLRVLFYRQNWAILTQEKQTVQGNLIGFIHSPHQPPPIIL